MKSVTTLQHEARCVENTEGFPCRPDGRGQCFGGLLFRLDERCQSWHHGRSFGARSTIAVITSPEASTIRTAPGISARTAAVIAAFTSALAQRFIERFLVTAGRPRASLPPKSAPTVPAFTAESTAATIAPSAAAAFTRTTALAAVILGHVRELRGRSFAEVRHPFGHEAEIGKVNGRFGLELVRHGTGRGKGTVNASPGMAKEMKLPPGTTHQHLETFYAYDSHSTLKPISSGVESWAIGTGA